MQNYEIIVADAVHCSGCCWRGLPPPPTQQVVRLACAIGGFSPALTKTRESKPDPPGIKTRPSGNQNPALRETQRNTTVWCKTRPSGNQNPALVLIKGVPRGCCSWSLFRGQSKWHATRSDVSLRSPEDHYRELSPPLSGVDPPHYRELSPPIIGV